MAGGAFVTGRPGYEEPGRSRGLLAALRRWPDSRVEPLLGAVASIVLILIAAMIVFVFQEAWPSFSANGLSWFGSGGDLTLELQAILDSPADPRDYIYTIHAWPLIWGTFLVTAGAVFFGIIGAVLAAVFIVEFAPRAINRVLEPVVRLLAAVPSVVYGLIGLLVIVPFFDDNLISDERRESVANVIQLNGGGLAIAVLILTIMITPIMIAIIVDALRAVPRSWSEGAAALGVNRWRVIWTIGLRASRPAIVAAAVLATARALGEAIMLSMVAGSQNFAPNPADGITFIFEPIRPLAAAIVENFEGSTVTPFRETLYAFAAVLLVSSMFLSIGAYIAKLPMRKYGVRP